MRLPATATSLHGTATPTEGTVSSCPVGRAHALLGIARFSTDIINHDAPSTAKRLQKERGPNWNPLEINALIDAKRQLYLLELKTIDSRDLMNQDASKWIHISGEVMKAGVSPCHCDGAACKSKWNQLIPDYKRINDFFSRTGTNEANYWDLTIAERKAEGLPKTFPQDVFFRIHEWHASRPAINPPHTRDLFSPVDRNFKTAVTASVEADHHEASFDGDEDPISQAPSANDSQTHRASTQSPLCHMGTSKVRTQFNAEHSSPTASPSRLPKGTIPSGVTPQLLSSSNNTDFNGGRRAGNTAVRRKSVSGHSLIAEATRATGDAMAVQLKELADASRDLERSKIDVQQRLFTEQMEYLKERDRRLNENARLANENSKLAIEKQGQVVQCLADLSAVLSAGLQRRLPMHAPAAQDHTPAAPGENTSLHAAKARSASFADRSTSTTAH